MIREKLSVFNSSLITSALITVVIMSAVKAMVAPTAMAERREREERREERSAQTKVVVRGLNFFYGRTQALHNISLDVPERVVTAFIGPSGCGKSTFLRTLNRMN